MSADAKTCPSARGVPGATLLGVKGADGRIKHMRTAMQVDAAFIKTASITGTPEARMRFASPCQTAGCAQWTGTRCGVIDKVLTHLEDQKAPLAKTLPPCTIRATCRWFDQSGDTACHACDLVVTDTTAIAAE